MRTSQKRAAADSGSRVARADRADQVQGLLREPLGLPAVPATSLGDVGEHPAVDVAELADRGPGAPVDTPVDPDGPGVGALRVQAVEDLPGAVAVAQRLEHHRGVPAVVDGPLDDVVAAELEPLEGTAVVLVVHLDSGVLLEAAQDHVRAGALNPDHEDRSGGAGRDGVLPAPAPGPDGRTDPLARVETVLLDQPGEPIAAQPLHVAAESGAHPGGGRAVLDQAAVR